MEWKIKKVLHVNLIYCVQVYDLCNSTNWLHSDSEAASFKSCIQRLNASQRCSEGFPNLKDPLNAPYKCLLLLSGPWSIQQYRSFTLLSIQRFVAWQWTSWTYLDMLWTQSCFQTVESKFQKKSSTNITTARQQQLSQLLVDKSNHPSHLQ